MTNALTLYDHDSTYAVVPQAASLAEQIARTDFAPAGLRGKPEAVMAAMLQGHELGIGAMASLSQISVINGKPCMSAQLMRGLVQRAGHELWFESKTNTKVVICGRRSNWPEDRIAKVTWTMDDARAAGLAGGQNYRKYPRAMLAARATGELCRDNFADVLGGIGYTPEELTDGDLVADGDLVVEGRADIEADAAPTNRRQAKRAPAKKSAAAKAPAAEKPAAAHADLPPLPGEDGFDEPIDTTATDDTADGVALATTEQLDDLQGRIDQLTQDERQDLGEWWKAQGLPPLRSGDLDVDQLDQVLAAVAAYAPGDDPGATEGRNKKMWAMVAEAWPGDSDEDRDEMRRHLIHIVTAERTESSKDLAPPEWDGLFQALEDIAAGTHELWLNGRGVWVIRKAPKRTS